MKKLLLVALALLVSTVSFAQFRTAPREAGAPMATKTLEYGMASDFTVNTLDNQTIRLQDWLDSGYYVLLDISATWCTWCWYLHSAHVLENIYNNYGPNGTNEVRVLWVEGDASTAVEGIRGVGNNTLGDWTNGVSYPIANDDNISELYNVVGYPTVLLICPSGYYQDAYNVCVWNGSSFVTNSSVAAIYSLLGRCPLAGEPPVVEIDGMSSVLANSDITFSASYVSVDSVTGVSWSIPGATPSTGTGDNITVTFPAAGSYTVSLTVTNTVGSTTETLNVNAIEWDWDNTMSYELGGSYVSSIGSSSGITWGVKFPATFMTNRNYLDNVQVYANESAHYTMQVYQTNPDAAPTNNDLIYQYTYAVQGSTYNTLPIYDYLQLNNSKDLWVAFTCTEVSYPAAGTTYSGDPNGSLVYWNGAWSPIFELSSSLVYTWMIKVTTSETAPSLIVNIEGPTEGQSNSTLTFTAAGPVAATYSWSFDGGTPATATGMSASVSFATAGNHTVTLTATGNGETATATHTVNIVSCDAQNLPWRCGFEPSENFNCWKFIDQDGDGNGWNLQTAFSPRTGSGVAASASYINELGVLYPDNWMITPKIIIPENGATIEWYEYGQDINDYADHYGVFVSTTGNDPANFTYMIFEGAPEAPQTWRKHSRSLAGFAGQEIYIAFRHYNISNMYWLLIDDLNITAGNTASIDDVEAANISLYPNPVNNILHINAQGIQEVNIIDVNGRTVMTQMSANTIDMSNLANGVYFVRVITNEGVYTQKIAKK